MNTTRVKADNVEKTVEAEPKEVTATNEKKTKDEKEPEGPRECFIIMPISDPEGYDAGHFKHVYLDLYRPACEMAGYKAVRADDIVSTNMIHEDVLRRIVDSPMAICDLTTLNPNVMFELGIRQAFDKPVILIQEVGTRRIFDISPMRSLEYSRLLRYHDVLSEQQSIAEAIRATEKSWHDGVGINSLIKLLSLARPATLTDVSEIDKEPIVQLFRRELATLRADIQKTSSSTSRYASHSSNQRYVPRQTYGYGYDMTDFLNLAQRNEFLAKLLEVKLDPSVITRCAYNSPDFIEFIDNLRSFDGPTDVKDQVGALFSTLSVGEAATLYKELRKILRDN